MKAQEFFKLAAVYLDIRWHQVNTDKDKVFLLLGELDYAAEMHLLLSEIRKERS